jgi:hypothetical protein
MDPTQLTEVNRRIAQVDRRVEQQNILIEELRKEKKDTVAAKAMLKALIAFQEALLARRDVLNREIEDECFGGKPARADTAHRG